MNMRKEEEDEKERKAMNELKSSVKEMKKEREEMGNTDEEN